VIAGAHNALACFLFIGRRRYRAFLFSLGGCDFSRSRRAHGLRGLVAQPKI
jgi:hypothetical protein